MSLSSWMPGSASGAASASSGLSSWSRSPKGQTEAVHRLERLPKVRHGVQPPAPLVVGDKSTYHEACAKAGNAGHLSPDIKAAPIVEVPLAGIHTIQSSVNPDRVLQYLRNPGLTPPDAVGKHGGPVGFPIVVKAGGVRYHHDGLHRMVAAILRGERTIKARFVDLDKK